MRLRSTGLRFRGKLKIQDGQTFLGQILDPPDTSRVSNFLSARRYLRTGTNTPIKFNDVIIANGVKFIVAEHAEGFFKEPIYKHFKLFQVNEERDWFVTSSSIDSLTGIRGKDFVFNKKVAISIQPKNDIEDFTNIQVPQHDIIINGAVSVGDKLGENWIVTKSDAQLGVTTARVKES